MSCPRAACLATAIATACLAAPLRAQEPAILQGLVVTANRQAEPEWAAAAHTTILDGAELERAGIESTWPTPCARSRVWPWPETGRSAPSPRSSCAEASRTTCRSWSTACA